MSIATMSGDKGTTALAGGVRLSKADLRVESYGTVDELNACLGFARSICSDAEISGWTEEIQRTLFRVGAALSTSPENPKMATFVKTEDTAMLTELVYRIEGMEGILSDWTLPGSNRESSAFEIARTVCRRGERCVVRLSETGEGEVPGEVIAYMNRLSDLIWLFGRLIEVRAGVDSRLRPEGMGGAGFSRAW